MATNLAIDDRLLTKALEIGGYKSKKDTVNAALDEFIKRRKAKELIEGNYRIIYAIEGSTVTIHTIIDSRRNIEDLLLKKLLRIYS